MRIIIQFHAVAEEIVTYLNSVSSELSLIMTVMILRPFALREINSELSLGDLMLRTSDTDIRIILTKGRPNIMANSPNQFFDLNPGVISIDIGSLTERGLQESALSFGSDDKEKIAIANKIASKLKKITKAGVVAVNPISGAAAAVRSHRYTEGAKAMYDGGVKILPVAGHCVYKLPD